MKIFKCSSNIVGNQPLGNKSTLRFINNIREDPVENAKNNFRHQFMDEVAKDYGLKVFGRLRASNLGDESDESHI